jgi:two-component system C4-dicarboxylate transport response regulator DctD
MRRLMQTIAQVADTGADVLIQGETGTGKELVARALHELSSRRDKHFVALNCGALAESILESELFGHEAGAFTGAQGKRIGKFEHANGGTVFLDEIESMPLSPQIKLLRVLQERVIERLGSNEQIPLDVRVVAATKRDLREAAATNEFREDLYYRLNVVMLDIPPLRERREDITYLFHHFLLTAAARFKMETPQISEADAAALIAYEWPGNVRELRNVAERCVLLGQGVASLSQLIGEGNGGDGSGSLRDQVENFERVLIERALQQSGGSVGEAMAVLDLPRKTLYDKIKKYGMDTKSFR